MIQKSVQAVRDSIFWRYISDIIDFETNITLLLHKIRDLTLLFYR